MVGLTEGRKLVATYVIDRYDKWLKGESGYKVAEIQLNGEVEYIDELSKDINTAYKALLEAHLKRVREEIARL